jgi:hypothetical protein
MVLLADEAQVEARFGLFGDSAKWKLVLVCLGIVPILTQDRCMVCAERTIDSKIVLDASDETHR